MSDFKSRDFYGNNQKLIFISPPEKKYNRSSLLSHENNNRHTKEALETPLD